MSAALTRKRLLGMGVGAGAVLLVRAPRAAAVDAPPDGDLAYLRLLIGAELLAIDFQTRALAARRTSRAATSTLQRVLADEKAHYASLAGELTRAGQAPAASGDVDFAYPRGSFASPLAISRLGWRIETLLLGAYLGAIQSVETPQLRLRIGQIAASEAQHLSAIAPLARQVRIGRAFPAALTMGDVSARLDAFES